MIYRSSLSTVYSLIKSDFDVWINHEKKESSFLNFLKYTSISPHRKLMAYRCLRGGVFLKVLKFVLNKSAICSSFYLPYGSNHKSIGEGLLVMHGFSTIINCIRMGNNCVVFQQVTIGATTKGSPTIGNNVVIYSGAKVLGDITIGDDVIVGANAVVIRDIPSHSIVVGVPARIIKMRKSMSDEWHNIKQ